MRLGLWGILLVPHPSSLYRWRGQGGAPPIPIRAGGWGALPSQVACLLGAAAMGRLGPTLEPYRNFRYPAGKFPNLSDASGNYFPYTKFFSGLFQSSS